MFQAKLEKKKKTTTHNSTNAGFIANLEVGLLLFVGLFFACKLDTRSQ